MSDECSRESFDAQRPARPRHPNQSEGAFGTYVNGVLSPLAVGAGIDRDFVYGTASGENTFTVKAVDQAGNTWEASNAATDVC